MIEPNFEADEFAVKDERAWWRKLLFPPIAVLAFLLAVFAVCVFLLAGNARGAPIAEAGGDGVRVVLTDEPCAISAVSNLKMRATWTENGKATEGCFGVNGGIVTMYFDDKTAVSVPAEVFKRVTVL